MPTPFMHLQMAQEIRHGVAGRSQLNESAANALAVAWPAFLLGTVAADYQTLVDVPREVSHFYSMPPAPDEQPHLTMLARHPELRYSTQLPPGRAAFVAGYATHLALDVLWFHDILMPHFVVSDRLGDREDRFLLHSILLAYLDQRALSGLQCDVWEILAEAPDIDWLPFALAEDLMGWRDMLVRQLRPGGHALTVEILAGRLHMTARDFRRRLDDERWLEANLRARVPLPAIEDALASGVTRSTGIVIDYFSPSAEGR